MFWGTLAAESYVFQAQQEGMIRIDSAQALNSCRTLLTVDGGTAGPRPRSVGRPGGARVDRPLSLGSAVPSGALVSALSSLPELHLRARGGAGRQRGSRAAC